MYRTSALWDVSSLLQRLRDIVPKISSVSIELCYHIESVMPLDDRETSKLKCLLRNKSEPELLTTETRLSGKVLEFGTRPSRVTPDSTNAVSICWAGGLKPVTRLEVSRRYQIVWPQGTSKKQRQLLCHILHDQMTEQLYPEPLQSFTVEVNPEPVYCIPTLERGQRALRKFVDQAGLAFSDEAIDYLCQLARKLGRNLTNVEVYNFGQLNSDHSRHITFALTKWRRNGVVLPQTLMDLIRQTFERHPGRTLSAFHDNAAAIMGFDILVWQPELPGQPSAYASQLAKVHITYKKETHNHPSAFEPYEGGGTGLLGLLRDLLAEGRGGEPVGCAAQYGVSNMYLGKGYRTWLLQRTTSHSLKSAVEILIGASNGISDTGNQIGQPLICGTAREFRLNLGREEFGFDKPWIAAGAIGEVRDGHVDKAEQKVSDLIVQLGGDAYRIGLGGASASSKASGTQSAQLDFDSVQRANAEMQQRDWRVVRACVELGPRNPIIDIQDLGAGGDCNAVTELIRRLGGKVYLRRIPCGDVTMSVLVYWCNESQERLVIIIRPSSLELVKQIAKRERCPLAVIGEVDGSGKLVLVDEQAPLDKREQRFPVDLELKSLLGDLPIQIRDLKPARRVLRPLVLPSRLTLADALQRVLRLVSVGSKSYLTSKVDRSVGGRVVQQPTVGPLQLPLADVGVVASGYDGLTGSALALGEHPISWLVNPEASVRMSIAEAIMNLAAVCVLDFESISLSGNWGVPVKAPGEADRLYRAVEAVNILLDKLGISLNVGKDSTSMEVHFTAGGRKHRVQSPGMFTASAYAPVLDIRKKATPDIKQPGKSKLMLLDGAKGKLRLGGSALAYVYGQVGDEVPDVDEPQLLVRLFGAIQRLIERGLILSYHDRCADGGLMVAALEMAFAGNCGLALNLSGFPDRRNLFALAFAQEVGGVIEYLPKYEDAVVGVLRRAGLVGCYHIIGRTAIEPDVSVHYNRQLVWQESTAKVRDWWHEISYRLDCQQANPETAKQERQALLNGRGLHFNLSFTPRLPKKALLRGRRPKVAVLREEGTNGDRELARVLDLVGFQTYDVTMTDLAQNQIRLSEFRGLVLAGGFSFKDVFGAGKGWAFVIKNNPCLHLQFEQFIRRQDTFILGICNGFQVLTELGLLPGKLPKEQQPSLITNLSNRFESRLVMTKVMPSPSIFLQNMVGSTLGIWVAHKEGRSHFPASETLLQLMEQQLVPLCYVDDQGQPTTEYPFNPNGSPHGIASLTTADGRFMGMMPHPERLFRDWQWPYWPEEWKKLKASPWLQMFVNAREWC